jgi:hypothetical protein
VALAQADGHFSPYTVWEASGATSTDRFGDFNGDGRADLLQINNGTAYVAYANFAGTGFGAWTTFATNASPSDRVADMNGDNRADLVQVFNHSAYVALATGAGGNGTAVPYEIWANGVTPSDRLGDVNGDGLGDLVQVTGSGNINVYQSVDVPVPDQHLIIA